MSSQLFLLNTSSSSKFKEFNPKDIEVLPDREGQPWIKEAHVGKLLGIRH